MALDKINEYPITAVVIDSKSYFDIDQWNGVGWQSERVEASLMYALLGQHIGNSNLTIDDDIRNLIMKGNDPGQSFNIRDDTDVTSFFKVNGSGVITFNEEYSFPLLDGAANQVLTTNGANVASWQTPTPGPDTNIGENDLDISAGGQRQLKMFASTINEIYALRDAGDTFNLKESKGDGSHRFWRSAAGLTMDMSNAGKIAFGTLAGNNYGVNFGVTGTQAATFASVNGTMGSLAVYYATRTGTGGGVTARFDNSQTTGFKTALQCKVSGAGSRNTAAILDAQGGTTNIAADVIAGHFAFPIAGAGSMIGTGTNNLISVYGATPIVQGAALTAADATATDGTIGTNDTITNNLRVRLNEMEARLSAAAGFGIFA